MILLYMVVPIGKIIKEITERKGMTKSELGRRLIMSPTNVHKIFKRETIDTGLLLKISDVLEYDFFSHYTLSKNYDNAAENPALLADLEAEYKKELQQCHEKVMMLERINELLEEKTQRLEKSREN